MIYHYLEMQPSTSEERLSKLDETVRQNGEIESSKVNDVTVVAMVVLDNGTDSQNEGRVHINCHILKIVFCQDCSFWR